MDIQNRNDLPSELIPEVERELELIKSTYSHEAGYDGDGLYFSPSYKRLCQYGKVVSFSTQRGKRQAIDFLESLLPLPAYNLDSKTIPQSVHNKIKNLRQEWLKNTSTFDQLHLGVRLFEFKEGKIVDLKNYSYNLDYPNDFNRSYAIQVLGWCDLMLQKETND